MPQPKMLLKMLLKMGSRIRLMVAMLALLLAAACTSGDDQPAPSQAVTLATATSTQASLGGLNLNIAALAIGANGDQLPLNSSVKIEKIDDASGRTSVQAIKAGAKALSPTYRITVKDAAGADISNRAVAAAHRVTLIPNRELMNSLNLTADKLIMVKISGTTATAIRHATTEVLDSRFALDSDQNPSALVSNFSDFLLIDGSGTTTPPPPVVQVLAGELTTAAGAIATFNLTHEPSGDTVLIALPDLLLSVPGIPITMNPSNFDIQMPTSPNNRSLILTSGANTFSSFNVGASVTLTVTSRTGGESAGTITGTAIAGSGAMRTLNYTFTTTVPVANSDLTIAVANFAIDASATHGAATAAVHNGTAFMALSLSVIDANPTRTLESVSIASADGALGTPSSITPVENFVAADVLVAAFGNNRIFVLGEDNDSESGNVVCHVLDEAGADLTVPLGFVVAAGFAPEVAYNAMADRFAVAYQHAAGVSLSLYAPDGTLEAGPIAISVDTSADLKGLCASGTSGEFLVTFSETTSPALHAMRVSASDGSLGGDIALADTTDSGLCFFDALGGAYLVSHGANGARMMTALTPGSDVLGMSAASPQVSGANAAAGGNLGGIFVDQTVIPFVGTANTFVGGVTNAGVPTPSVMALAPQATGGLPTTFNDGAARVGVAADQGGRFLVLGRDSTNGVTGIILAIGGQ